MQNDFISWLRYKLLELRHFHKDELRAKLDLPLLSARRMYFDLLKFHLDLKGIAPYCGNVALRVPYRNVSKFCPLTFANTDSLVRWERTQALAAPYIRMKSILL